MTTYNKYFNTSTTGQVQGLLEPNPAVQCNKIDGLSISSTQWGYLSSMNQGVGTGSNITVASLSTDEIKESTSSNGVVIDGVTLKDGKLATGSTTISIGSDADASTEDISIGKNAGSSSAGGKNILIGTDSGKLLATTGADAAQNVLIGYQAGDAMTTAYSSVCVGAGAGGSHESGFGCVHVGFGSDSSAISQYVTTVGTLAKGVTKDVAIGFNTGSLTSGGRNVSIGESAGNEAPGDNNVLIGYQAGTSLEASGDEADDNVCVGQASGSVLTTGRRNIFLGKSSGVTATTAVNNICIGVNSDCPSASELGVAIGDTTYTDSYDVSIGNSTGSKDTLGYNVSLGFNACDATPGDHNVSIGSYAGSALARTGATDAKRNVLIGYHAGLVATTGSFNTLLGSETGIAVTSGSNNVAIGNEALYQCTTALGNVAVGRGAGASIVTTTSDDNNTCCGSYSDCTGTNGSALGYGAVATSNEVYLGDTNITSFKCQVALTVVSDERYKKQIEPLEQGLDFINKLEPKSFVLRDDPEERTRFGLIAQDVEKIDDRYMDKRNTSRYGICYENFIAPLINAVKELDEKYKTDVSGLAKIIGETQDENEQLKKTIRDLKYKSDIMEFKLNWLIENRSN